MAAGEQDRRGPPALVRALTRILSSKPGSWYFLHVANPIDKVLVPLTRGWLSLAPGQPVLVLEHVGAKSGQRRRTPLLYLTDGDDLVVIASAGGAARHPAWLHNLRAHPRVKFLITSSRLMKEAAHEAGVLAPIVDFGARITLDTCILASPMLPAEIKTLMTNSAKYAYYAPSLLGSRVTFGSLADCVRSAIEGRVVRDDSIWQPTV